MESRDKSDSQCLFCLEWNAKQIKKSSCSCRIYSHEACWKLYEEKKACIECPICHTITEPNPLELAMGSSLQQKIVVHSGQRDREMDTCQKGCFCCCLYYFCACGILSAIFG